MGQTPPGAETGRELIGKARAGDGDAFRALTDLHRRELLVHCYRMLGSFQDAEDALQETLLSAWNALEGFEERSSIRTWLYKIATHRCLNASRSVRRRASKEWNVPGVHPPEATRLGEVVWLQPFPDALLDRREAISLAFVTALQSLPPRQVAVLVLRDVLGFPASEVAEMLDTTVESVNSALKRARAGRRSESTARSPSDVELVTKFVRAYEAADLDAVVALLTDDVFVSMPPMPFVYEGRDAVARFCASIFAAGRRFDLVATGANGQPAFGTYLRGSAVRPGVGLIVLTVAGDRITAMTRFDETVLASFALPRSIR